MTQLQQRLFDLQDTGYREFHCRLMPTVPRERVIGVRIPVLRRLARQLWGTDEGKRLLSSLPHQYSEENNLHAFLIEQIRDFDLCIEHLGRFLPYVDNWATCDSLSPRVLATDRRKLLLCIERWIASTDTYVIRFGLKMLMTHFLDDGFDSRYLELAASVHSEEYYVNMMVAWLFATALSKQYDATLPYLEQVRLSPTVHGMTVRKALESFRLTQEQKQRLKALGLGK